jgi:protein-L-isoaspartate O-methyltransferase
MGARLKLMLATLKNALALLLRGDWREVNVRARIVLGQVDLKTVTTDDLDLPADRAHSYADSGGDQLEKLFAGFGISRRDSVIDFGCGKGGALITLAKFPFARVTGVEMSAALVEVARKNLAALGIGNVEIACCDAASYRELDDYNYVYLFNPFPGAVVRAVLENLEQSLQRRPRRVVIVYLNPVCHGEIVAGATFRKVAELAHSCHQYYIYSNEKA